MPDDTDTIQAPPSPVLPPGSGYTYSTRGPGDFRTGTMAPGPGGVSVPLPGNAQTYAAIEGAPAPREDAQSVMLRNLFNKLPVDEALKAYEAANQFQGTRIFQMKRASGASDADALMAAMPFFAKNASAMAQMANAYKTIKSAERPPQMTPYQQAEVDFRNRKLSQDAALARERLSQPGKLTQQQAGELKLLSTDKSGLQKALTASPPPDEAAAKEIKSKIDQITARQRELLGLPPVGQPKAAPPAPPKPSMARPIMAGLAAGGAASGALPMTMAPGKPATQFPPAPTDVKKRVEGQTYQTPKGPHTWTGKGWIPYDATNAQ